MRVGIALIEGYSFTREPVYLGVKGIGAAAKRIEALGFDLIIAPETAGHDPFLPLVAAAEHTERVQLATGVAVAFPRSPMVVAQMAWDLQRFSGGRFELALGTQVKGHNERRYATPWPSAPGPRMREYVDCLRAMFHSFQHHDDLQPFQGKHYRFDMLPPVFRPQPIDHPHIPICIAAVNPYMCRLAGERCDAVFVHPVCTAKYVREVMLPSIKEGAHRAGRTIDEIDVWGAPIIVTGRNNRELDEERKLLKRRVAFYASTRTYHPVFAVHGWKGMGEELHALSLEGRWEEMNTMIPDEMAAEFGTVAHADIIADELASRWGGVLTTLNLPTDFPLKSAADEQRAGGIIERLHEA